MIEFNAQEIIDFLSGKFLTEFDGLSDKIWAEFTNSNLKDCKLSTVFETVNKGLAEEYLKQRAELLKRYTENVRKVERYAVRFREYGVSCQSCVDEKTYKGDSTPCSNCGDWELWKPRYTIEDFK